MKNIKSIDEFNEDKIQGGLADDESAAQFDQDELRKGIEVEMEHTEDREIAKEIAMDHLKENPKYYSDLEAANIEPDANDKDPDTAQSEDPNVDDQGKVMASPDREELQKQREEADKEDAEGATAEEKPEEEKPKEEPAAEEKPEDEKEEEAKAVVYKTYEGKLFGTFDQFLNS